MLIRIVFLALLIGLLAFVVSRVRAGGGKGLFEIQIGEDRVDIAGELLSRTPGDVREFLHGLRLPIGARIRAVPAGAGFRLQFSKAIREEDRQRIRDFFHAA